MIEPVVVPFIWMILFLLVVQDADRQHDRTHHQSTRDRLARSMKELSPVLDVRDASIGELDLVNRA